MFCQASLWQETCNILYDVTLCENQCIHLAISVCLVPSLVPDLNTIDLPAVTLCSWVYTSICAAPA